MINHQRVDPTIPFNNNNEPFFEAGNQCLSPTSENEHGIHRAVEAIRDHLGVRKWHEHKDKGELAAGPRRAKLERVDRGYDADVHGRKSLRPSPCPNACSSMATEFKCPAAFVTSSTRLPLLHEPALSISTLQHSRRKDVMYANSPTPQRSNGSPRQAPTAPTPSSWTTPRRLPLVRSRRSCAAPSRPLQRHPHQPLRPLHHHPQPPPRHQEAASERRWQTNSRRGRSCRGRRRRR